MADENAPLELEKTLRLMDVADEIRRVRHRVEEHLESSDRERIRADLLQRYREMGHEADPALLDEAIETVLTQQNRFRPPEPGLGLRLARLYVRRREIGRKIARPVGITLLIVALVTAGALGKRWNEARREARTQQKIEELADRSGTLLSQVREIAREPEAVELAERHHADAERGRKLGDDEQVESSTRDLSQLLERLEQEYTLIITKGRERDGRRHYLIVEAVGPDGRPRRVKIRNEETGDVERVSEWGERVEKPVYDRVAADFSDNGVIDDNVLGRKQPGHLEAERRYPPLGQITRW